MSLLEKESDGMTGSDQDVAADVAALYPFLASFSGSLHAHEQYFHIIYLSYGRAFILLKTLIYLSFVCIFFFPSFFFQLKENYLGKQIH